MLYHSAGGRAVLDYRSEVTGDFLDFEGSAMLPWVDISLPAGDVSRGTQFNLAYMATDALSPHDDLGAYDGYLVISLPGTNIDGGSSSSGGRPFSALPVAASDHTFMCHETGHTPGFGHSYGFPNNGIDWDGKAPWDVGNVYGDPYDIMSSGSFGARWLDPDVAHTTSHPTFAGIPVTGWPNAGAFSMGPAPARAHLHLWTRPRCKTPCRTRQFHRPAVWCSKGCTRPAGRALRPSFWHCTPQTRMRRAAAGAMSNTARRTDGMPGLTPQAATADAGKKVGNGWDPAAIFTGGLNLR